MHDAPIGRIFIDYMYKNLWPACEAGSSKKTAGGRLKIKNFNREICVCALLATNSLIHFMDLAISWLCATKQRRNGDNYESVCIGM